MANIDEQYKNDLTQKKEESAPIGSWWDRQKTKAVNVLENADEALKNNTYTKFVYAPITEEVGPSVDPTKTTETREYAKYVRIGLNYTDFEYSREAGEVAAQLFTKQKTKKDLQESRKKLYSAALDPGHLKDVIEEINKRIEEINKLMAGFDEIYRAFRPKAGDGEEVEEDPILSDIMQAKADFKIFVSNISVITQLIVMISDALPTTKESLANIQKILESILDTLAFAETYVEFALESIEQMTDEEYIRVTSISKELKEKRKAKEKGNKISEIFNHVLTVAFDILHPYIISLNLMLTLEAANYILKKLEKVPGLKDIIQPPVTMIPAAITLTKQLVTGQLGAAFGRIKTDIEIVSNYLEASKIMSYSSIEDVEEAKNNFENDVENFGGAANVYLKRELDEINSKKMSDSKKEKALAKINKNYDIILNKQILLSRHDTTNMSTLCDSVSVKAEAAKDLTKTLKDIESITKKEKENFDEVEKIKEIAKEQKNSFIEKTFSSQNSKKQVLVSG